MLESSNPHVGVYQVLDGVLSSDTVPPGARGALFSIIDDLRAAAGYSELHGLAERVSLAIHALEGALQRSDQDAAQGARGELKALAGACLQARICPSM